MQALSFGRSNFAQTALIALLTLAVTALLGAVLAYWTWVWFAPRAEPRLQTPLVQGINVSSAGTIFGMAPRNEAAAVPTGIAIRLLGVVAATAGRRSYAVVQLEGKRILAAHEGEDIAPGIKLAQVLADHVILERNGARETLAWPTKHATAAPIARAGNRAGNR